MTNKQIQHLLGYLGYYTIDVDGILGKQSLAAIKTFQHEHGITADGIAGEETQKALLYSVTYGMPERKPDEPVDLKTGSFWDEIEFFDKEEMRCKCGGKYCNGYPHEIQPLLMQILDRARRWSGHPIKVISGLRCEDWNRIQGGVVNSQHKYGEAADVYFYGVTPGAALAWLQSQPEVRYAYQIAGCSNIHFDIPKVGR